MEIEELRIYGVAQAGNADGADGEGRIVVFGSAVFFS